MRGVITNINPKGFAFIRDEQGQSRFAHARSFNPRPSFDQAKVGDAVEFTPEKTEKGNGLGAVDVQCTN